MHFTLDLRWIIQLISVWDEGMEKVKKKENKRIEQVEIDW